MNLFHHTLSEILCPGPENHKSLRWISAGYPLDLLRFVANERRDPVCGLWASRSGLWPPEGFMIFQPRAVHYLSPIMLWNNYAFLLVDSINYKIRMTLKIFSKYSKKVSDGESLLIEGVISRCPLLRWEFIKENKKVRKQENKNSTKKAIKKTRK